MNDYNDGLDQFQMDVFSLGIDYILPIVEKYQKAIAEGSEDPFTLAYVSAYEQALEALTSSV